MLVLTLSPSAIIVRADRKRRQRTLMAVSSDLIVRTEDERFKIGIGRPINLLECESQSTDSIDN